MSVIRPQWIIFDAADTLLRPKPSVAAVYQDVAAKHGIFVDADEIRKCFGPAIRRNFADEISDETIDRKRWKNLVFEVLKTDNDQVFDDLWDHFASPMSWRVYEDVEPTWRSLIEAGFRIAIASNFDARLLGIVSALPPINLAEYVFISSQVGFRKPSPKFFAAIQTRLASAPIELMIVGDSTRADFEGAVNAGWQALLLDRDCDSPRTPTIATLASLPELFDK